MTVSPVRFVERARTAVGSEVARSNRAGAERLAELRDAARRAYPPFEAMRDRARRIRLSTLAELDTHLARFAEQVERRGGHVFFAADATEAVGYVQRVIRDHGVRRVVKSKSMVTEEIGLNRALEASGVDVVETDLGEFIIQLAGEHPSHIIAPAIHKTAADVGRLFADRLGVPYTDDPDELNRIARRHLRRIFLEADLGISGVNFAVAETGSICVVTNEGNGRLVTTAPRIHVAVMGMERIVPGVVELAHMLEVLARSGTGQGLSVYSNIVTGPRRPEDPDGPDELHVVIVDNGRSRALAGETAEILACIRCGACLNVCPVYRAVGGHAYGSVYTGPIGAVVTPALMGMDPWADLPFASTLCGACRDVCPVRIDIPRMLLHLRQVAAEEGTHPFRWVGPGLRAYRVAASGRRRWAAFLRLGGVVSAVVGRSGWIERLPFHGGGWTRFRSLRAPAKRPFRRRWRDRDGT